MEDWIKKLSVKQAKAILHAKKVDNQGVVEKGHLLSLVAEHVASREDADAALAGAAKAAAGGAGGAGGTGPGAAPAAGTAESELALKAAFQRMLVLPLAQLKYQAAVMKRDPAFVRRNNAILKAATDAQIMAAAEAMEARAKELEANPKADIAHQDETNADQMLDMITNRPEDFKKAIGTNPQLAALMKDNAATVSRCTRLWHCDWCLHSFARSLSSHGARLLWDGPFARRQVDEHLGQIRSIAKANAATVRWCFVTMSKVSRTVAAAYGYLNTMTKGNGKAICIVLALLIGCVYVRIAWAVSAWVWGATVGRLWGGSSSSSSSGDDGAAAGDGGLGDFGLAPVAGDEFGFSAAAAQAAAPVQLAAPGAARAGGGDDEWAEF